jgi:hypothetical protein
MQSGWLSLWWCAALMACVQIPARAQLFLVAQRPDTNAPAPDLVALGWNPSPSTNATGYFLCWGSSSGACTNVLDAGNVTSATVAGLEPNVHYYFTVVAYGAAGQEAPPSNVIMYPPGPTLNIQRSSGCITPGVSLSFQGIAGLVYSIQATSDFTNWTTLSTTNCSAAGSVEFQVTDMAAYPARFYRLLRE